MTTTTWRLSFAWLVLGVLIVAPTHWIIASFEGRHTEEMISHVFGAYSLMCMALTMILTARPHWIDAAFAGLDKAYVVHKWLGLLAWGTLLIHDTLESEIDGLKSPFGLHDLGSDMGVWVYNGILVLLAVTFLRMIPYRWWYLTHRFMLLLYVLSVAHFIVIPKPLALDDVGALYLMGWSFAGLVSGLFALRPARWRGGLSYSIANLFETADTRTLILEPCGKRLRHKPGQFVFLRGDGDLSEWHPFTISSAPDDTGRLRITFSERANWTKSLSASVAVGDAIKVRGPHGRFVHKPSKRRQVWVSAGVGVTPFLAWAQANQQPKGAVDIIHNCRSRAQVPHLSELEAYADAHEAVTLKVYETATRRRPDAQDILRLIKDRDEFVDLFFCGPTVLSKKMQEAFVVARKGRFAWHQESFEMRGDLPRPKWFRSFYKTLRDAFLDTVTRYRQS